MPESTPFEIVSAPRLMSALPILVLNAGSSSLKYALYVDRERVTSGTVGRIGHETTNHRAALEKVLSAVGTARAIGAVGHRIVHGGARFVAPVRIDDDVLAELRRLAPLAPDHLPAEITLIESMRALSTGTAQVACFDTAFHASMPRVSRLLPIPRRYETAGVRRYGFHGLSYEYLVGHLGDAARGRVIMAHLGAGASLCAARDGKSVDTTMGFTATGGIPMGMRTGDLDPGVLLYLMRTEGASAAALDDLVNKRSGLLGVSGISADMRDLLAREVNDPAAADAVAVFCHGVRKAVGAMAATLDGVDTLVFAGGIGENAAVVRERVCRGLAHLGVMLDPRRNDANADVVSADGSKCVVRVVRTDEEAVIARETAAVLEEGSAHE
jgi:acetate kinase